MTFVSLHLPCFWRRERQSLSKFQGLELETGALGFTLPAFLTLEATTSCGPLPRQLFTPQSKEKSGAVHCPEFGYSS